MLKEYLITFIEMIRIANISDSIEHISFRINMSIIIKCSLLLYNIYRYSSLLFICETIIDSFTKQFYNTNQLQHLIITTISNIVCSIKKVFCLIYLLLSSI